MAEQPQLLRGIDWRETFPFTHIFRAFRIAIHPSKLALALAALLAIYFGGRILDGVWPTKYRAVVSAPRTGTVQNRTGEIAAFERQGDISRWQAEEREAAARYYARLLPTLQDKGGDFARLADEKVALEAARAGRYQRDVKYRARMDLEKAVTEARRDHQRALTAAPKAGDERTAAVDAATRERDQSIGRAFDEYAGKVRAVEAIRGRGLFITFFEFETSQINQVVDGILVANWLGGGGVFPSLYRFFVIGPLWLIQCHWLFALLFGLLLLVVWSLFGGAIARIAAVHVADEGRKLSIRQGLNFAIGKFLSFVSAPLIPLLIMVVIGVIVAIGGLLVNVPYVGEILVGILYFLALAAGFVITLVLIGTVGGFNLMYPTIAVEGSDSFDAISRSFSYIYSKPWRMIFYTGVALVYGALTYVFARIVVFLVLALTHYFAGALVFRAADEIHPLWSTIAPPPSFEALPYSVHYEALGTGGDITAFFIACWSYLVIAMLGAFAISFYFSANTIIYYLMRREVDATEMDDVYLEQPEEEFAEAAAPAETAAAPAAPEAPASEPAPGPAETQSPAAGA